VIDLLGPGQLKKLQHGPIVDTDSRFISLVNFEQDWSSIFAVAGAHPNFKFCNT
jgi:hypothetical protein